MLKARCPIIHLLHPKPSIVSASPGVLIFISHSHWPLILGLKTSHPTPAEDDCFLLALHSNLLSHRRHLHYYWFALLGFFWPSHRIQVRKRKWRCCSFHPAEKKFFNWTLQFPRSHNLFYCSIPLVLGLSINYTHLSRIFVGQIHKPQCTASLMNLLFMPKVRKNSHNCLIEVGS